MERLVWLACVLGLCVAGSACGSSDRVGATDGGVTECEGDDCDGSEPGDDGAVDEREPDASDERDAAVDEELDMRDATTDEGEPEVDASVDEASDAAVDANVDGGDSDAAIDAEIEEPPPNCRDDYECGGYGTCDESLEVPVCECIVGYRDSGEGCLWGGGVADSDLDDASAWTATNVTFAGGTARFETSGAGDACEIGVLQQMVPMPARAQSQAFVVELDVLSSCTSSDAESCPALQVELGAGASRLVVAGDPGAAATPVARTVSVCVGQTGYGASVPLRVRPALAYQYGQLPLSCETAEWPAIDRLAIRPAYAGECAADDTLLGALSSSAGWTLANATIAGGQLAINAGGRAETVIAFSSAVQGRALAIQGSIPGAQQAISVSLDGLTWSSASLPAFLCIPEWAAGASHRVAFTRSAGSAATISGVYTLSAPECGDNVFDEHFERLPARGSWASTAAPITRTAGYEGYGIHIPASTSLLGSLRMPARESAYRIAAHARYRNMSPQVSALDFALDTTTGETDDTTSWRSRTVCLPNRWEHQLATLRFDVMMTPDTAGGAVSMTVDDLGLIFALPTECE